MQTGKWFILPAIHRGADPRPEGQIVVDAAQEPEASTADEEQTSMSRRQRVIRLANRIQRVIDGERRCTYSIADLMQAVGIIAYEYGREDQIEERPKKKR